MSHRKFIFKLMTRMADDWWAGYERRIMNVHIRKCMPLVQSKKNLKSKNIDKYNPNLCFLRKGIDFVCLRYEFQFLIILCVSSLCKVFFWGEWAKLLQAERDLRVTSITDYTFYWFMHFFVEFSRIPNIWLVIITFSFLWLNSKNLLATKLTKKSLFSLRNFT